MNQKTIEQKFRKLNDVEHALIRPGRYIGSVKPHTAETWVVTDGKMARKEITWNPGLIKLFDEVISNSVDHSKRPEGKQLDKIQVEIDRAKGQISVMDNGGIPVVTHAEHKELVPTLIFGYLRSGSNFDDTDDTDVTGQNGEGATLTNIFSTSFSVETCDGKKKFRQTWTNNMRKRTEPTVAPAAGSKGYTKITFTPDYKHLETQLDDGSYEKLVKRVYDVAGCNPRLKVYLNGERISIKSFEDYIRLYVDEFEFEDSGDWQVAVAHSTEGNFQHISFVNSTETVQGGTHVSYVAQQVASAMRELINKKYKIDLKPSEILNHLRIFINARIIRPRYDSQTKENLITETKEFKTAWAPSERFVKAIFKSAIIKSILIWVEAKAKAEEMAALKELNKDVDKADPRRVEKFSDAIEKVDRHRCELYLTEGDSARKSIQEARGKNPYIGSFALKGKPLNITDCERKDILENAEIKSILLVTGLKIGVEVRTVHQLRFGKIVIMSDQDLDGFHVASLLLNFFAHFWPELFRLGVIHRISTPLVIATLKKGETKEFMKDEDYEAWARTAPKHTARRYKGLGTFTTPVFKRVIENREKYLVRFGDIEQIDQESLSLAFEGSRADDRKDWLEGVNYFHNFDE